MVPFVTVTIYNGVIRYGLSKEYQINDVFKSGFGVTLIGCFFSFAITPLFSYYAVVSAWKWYLCIYVCMYSLYTLCLNFLKIIDKNKAYAGISILNTFVFASLNFLLIAKFNFGVHGFIISNIIAVSLSTVIAAFYCDIVHRIMSGKINKKLIVLMIQFSAPIVINDICWSVIHSSDKIMIELMLGASVLGLYTIATKIPSLINVFISVFSQSWGISSIKEFESSNDVNFYSTVFNYYSTLTYMVAIFVILIARPFMRIYVSMDYFESWRFVPILLASAAFSAISTYFGALYGALKINIHSMVTTIIAALTNIVVNYVGIKNFGVWGAVVGTLSAYALIAHIRFFDTMRYVKLKIRWFGYIVNSISVIIVAIIVTNVENYLWYCFPICVLGICVNQKFFHFILKLRK